MVQVRGLFQQNIFRHFIYFLSFHLINGLVHLVLLSIVAFFHFLLDHRLADIQDWVFFHGWEILIIGNVVSLYILTRFLGILSIERKPFLSLIKNNKGIFRKEVLASLIIFLLGLILLGKPTTSPSYEPDMYRILISILGQFVLYGSECLILLSLNKYLPLRRKQWHFELILFSLITFFIHKLVFLYGIRWEGQIIFQFILLFYLLRLRGEFVWLHSFLFIGFLVAPVAALFGLDPIWGERFSPFTFTSKVGGLEVGCFTFVTLVYLRAKRYHLFSL